MSVPTSPFGRPTSSAPAPQSEFGQANNANNSPFVVTSFGGTTPFGSPAGGSVYRGTSTGVFGGGSTRTPSPFSSEAAFGAFASSAGGSGSSNPASGPFGFTPAQTSTSGTNSHPSQTAIGSDIFHYSMPLGAQSPSLLGTSSNPGSGSSNPAYRPSLFGTSSNLGSGSSNPASGPSLVGTSSNPGSGSSNPASGPFGFTPAQTSTFGATSRPSQPAIGSSLFHYSTPLGAQSPSLFETSSNPGSGSSNPAPGPFGFTPAQTSTSGTASHPSQPAIGSIIFHYSMPLGTQSPSLFGTSSNPGSGLSNPAPGPFGFTPAQTSTSGTASHSSQPAVGSIIFHYSMPSGARSPSFFGTSSNPGSGSSNPASGPFGFTPVQTSTSGTTSHPSQPAMGSIIFHYSMPLGAQSPLFGTSSNPGSGSSNPASGPFGFTPAQTSSSGTTSHPSQPAIGSNIFHYTMPLGAHSPSLFGTSSNPGSGSSNPFSGPLGFTVAQTSTSGSTSHPSRPAFGSSVFHYSKPLGAQSPSFF